MVFCCYWCAKFSWTSLLYVLTLSTHAYGVLVLLLFRWGTRRVPHLNMWFCGLLSYSFIVLPDLPATSQWNLYLTHSAAVGSSALQNIEHGTTPGTLFWYKWSACPALTRSHTKKYTELFILAQMNCWQTKWPDKMLAACCKQLRMCTGVYIFVQLGPNLVPHLFCKVAIFWWCLGYVLSNNHGRKTLNLLLHSGWFF